MANDCYCSPRWLTEPLGHFDLDPCAHAFGPWEHADSGYCLARGENGLAEPWYGRVWLNCPYSDPYGWLGLMSKRGNGIAVVNVATSAAWWRAFVWGYASAVRFLDKRVKFWTFNVPTWQWVEARAPMYENALVAWGMHNAAKLVMLDEHPDERLKGRTILL